LAKKGVVDGINGVEAMFTSSRDIGTHCTEDVGPVFITKAAGDLLLDLNHTHSSLGYRPPAPEALLSADPVPVDL